MRSACASQYCWRSDFFLSFSSSDKVASRSISVNSLIRSGNTNAFGSSGFRNGGLSEDRLRSILTCRRVRVAGSNQRFTEIDLDATLSDEEKDKKKSERQHIATRRPSAFTTSRNC